MTNNPTLSILTFSLLFFAKSSFALNVPLTVNCEILNENHVSQTTFAPGETASFGIKASLQNTNDLFLQNKTYHADLKISASSDLNSLNIPINLNTSTSIPINDIIGLPLFEKEESVTIPSVPGKFTLKVNVSIPANKTILKADCTKTILISKSNILNALKKQGLKLNF